MMRSELVGAQLRSGDRIPCKDPVCRLLTCTHQEKKRVVLVVAGNRLEAERELEARAAKAKSQCVIDFFGLRATIDGVRYIYCKDCDDLRGYHGVEVEFWGTAYDRKDMGELMVQAHVSRRP